jgi:hypothetical protein
MAGITQYYSNLRFFDKSGNPCNFAYDPTTDTWSGTMYFPRVSTGLYENAHIFVVEDVIVGSTPDVTFPVLANQGAPAESQYWQTSWTDDNAMAQIFNYLVVADPTTGLPFIQAYEQIQYVNTVVPYAEASPSTTKVISSANSTPLKINIAFTSTHENIYQRTMLIQDLSFGAPRTIATILFYGETVGEDERLRLVLQNFGRTFDQVDELMTSDSDIMEPLPNWINTNTKRKELLLTGEEIYPYIGSYKGLINAVKFFGYQDLRIKEYWLNIDANSPNYNKVQHYELVGLFTGDLNPLIRNPLVPSSTYKKTSMFGLYYDITVATGSVDDFGIPITVDDSQFTDEEVLVKLFALKNKLMQEYLPVSAKIVDIVGEGIYFDGFGVSTWVDPLENYTISLGDNINFTSNLPVGFNGNTIGYVRDLRKFQVQVYPTGLSQPVEHYTNTVNPYTSGQVYPPSAIQGLVDSINQFYTDLLTVPFPYLGEKPEYQGDEPGILAGCPIILQANVSSFTWDDMNMTWDNLSYESGLSSPSDSFGPYTWDTINFSNYYEIQWTITNPVGYNFTIRGRVQDYYILPHFLPYSGEYNVSLVMYDMFNQQSIQNNQNFVQVMDRQVEVTAFCRFRNTDDYTWDGSGETWDDLAGSTWVFPIEGVSDYASPINEKLLNWARYRNQDDQMILNPSTGLYEPLISAFDNPLSLRVGTRNLNWDGMGDLPWDEMYHSTWNMYDYHGEFLGGFRIFDPGYGDTVQVDDWAPFTFAEPSPVVPLDLQSAADQLNASLNPGIAKFTYVVRFQPNASPTLAFIHACAKQGGADGWRFITYTAASSPGIYGDKYSFREPTWLDTIQIDTIADEIDNIYTPAINIDRDLLFLDVPLEDLILDDTSPSVTPRPDQLAYWQAKGYLQTIPPTPSNPYGIHRGELPSWYGTGAFNMNDLRVFSDGFDLPLGVPCFLICGMSEVPGMTDVNWIITNQLTGEVVMNATGKPFLIINFIEESFYTVECYLQDSNGNTAYTKRTGLVHACSRANMNQPANLNYA